MAIVLLMVFCLMFWIITKAFWFPDGERQCLYTYRRMCVFILFDITNGFMSNKRS